MGLLEKATTWKDGGFMSKNSNVVGSIGTAVGSAVTSMDALDGEVNVGQQAAGTALQFAGAGMALGPLGAIGGGILGGIIGLIKGKKMKEQAEQAKITQKWNASVASKPNPMASDVSAAQYGADGGEPKSYLDSKFGIKDPGLLEQMQMLTN